MANETQKPDLFDWLNSINENGENILDRQGVTPKDYPVYAINKGMAQHIDTIMMAEQMNKYWSLPLEMQYKFLLHGVSKKKRRGKWAKTQKPPEEVVIIASMYGVNHEVAQDYICLMSESRVQSLIDKWKTKETLKENEMKV